MINCVVVLMMTCDKYTDLYTNGRLFTDRKLHQSFSHWFFISYPYLQYVFSYWMNYTILCAQFMVHKSPVFLFFYLIPKTLFIHYKKFTHQLIHLHQQPKSRPKVLPKISLTLTPSLFFLLHIRRRFVTNSSFHIKAFNIFL